MDSEPEFDTDLLMSSDADGIETPALRAAPRRRPAALVVDDDPETARICARRLDRLGIDATVVWEQRDALDLLSHVELPLAFVYVNDGLRDGSGPDVAAEARRLRPGMPVVEASASICDVLTGDGIVLCTPFTADQFQTAFDAAILDETTRNYAAGFEEVPESADLQLTA
jgi:ActR/RegA family two-component response regulator